MSEYRFLSVQLYLDLTAISLLLLVSVVLGTQAETLQQLYMSYCQSHIIHLHSTNESASQRPRVISRTDTDRSNTAIVGLNPSAGKEVCPPVFM